MITNYYRKAIKNYRKREKLTQEKPAGIPGCDTTCIRCIETARNLRALISLYNFQICQAFRFIICFAVKPKSGNTNQA